jgi:hypothetical protein
MSLNTRGLFHITPADSGTPPTIFFIANFSSPP